MQKCNICREKRKSCFVLHKKISNDNRRNNSLSGNKCTYKLTYIAYCWYLFRLANSSRTNEMNLMKRHWKKLQHFVNSIEPFENDGDKINTFFTLWKWLFYIPMARKIRRIIHQGDNLSWSILIVSLKSQTQI